MSALGWSEKSGIGGSDLNGNPNHIVVARKLDNSGIGVGRAKKEGDDAASGAGMAGAGLDSVLRRLAEASRSGTTTPVEVVEEVKTDVVPARNRIA
jgi:Pin2-interacting protein X1